MNKNFLNIATFDFGRQRRLRAWMCLEGVNWQDLGQVMGISGNAAAKALSNDHLWPERHALLLSAFPTLTVDLLPRPEKIPPGRPRKESSAALV